MTREVTHWGWPVYQILHIRDWSSIEREVKESSSTMRLVRRRGLVCDAEQEGLEPTSTDEIGPSCPSCGAPTELTAALPGRRGSTEPPAGAPGRPGGLEGGAGRRL